MIPKHNVISTLKLEIIYLQLAYTFEILPSLKSGALFQMVPFVSKNCKETGAYYNYHQQ